jgi:hypothetical protein
MPNLKFLLLDMSLCEKPKSTALRQEVEDGHYASGFHDGVLEVHLRRSSYFVAHWPEQLSLQRLTGA